MASCLWCRVELWYFDMIVFGRSAVVLKVLTSFWADRDTLQQSVGVHMPTLWPCLFGGI